jgi:glycosyltransferase involved in cell wall biosynthesis
MMSQGGSQLRVALDARTLDAPQRRGIGRSLYQLYVEISRLRPQWELLLVHRGVTGQTLITDRENVREHCVRCAGDRWDLWGRLRLPVEAWRLRADVLHSPANVGPDLSSVPLVLTVHDLIPVEHSASGPDLRWMRLVQRAAEHARHILTPSNYSRNRLIAQLGLDGEKIIVCPWAADPSCQRCTNDGRMAEVRQRHGVGAGRPFVLAFGAADPRKNTSGLIDAWRQIAPARRKDWLLLIVGIQRAAIDAFHQQVRQHDLQESVLLREFVASDDLPVLLSAAEVLAYPSLGEGFGLPVLEGFACGTAVLSSNVTSLPEVAGNAALLVDPKSTAAISRGLEQLMSDERMRGELGARGLARSSMFSWTACAEITCIALEGALS